MTNSVDPDQTAPIGTVCSGSTLFPSIPNWSVMLGNYLQQTTSADDFFRFIFFLGAFRNKKHSITNFLIKIYHGCEGRIEKNPSCGSPIGITRLAE